MIIGFPHPPASGGPGSFQNVLEAALKERGWDVVYPGNKAYPDIILVVGGTRNLSWLLKNKLRKIPILHRLDGLDWHHRLSPWSRSHTLKAELTNYLIRIIRDYFATHIIYQSIFVKKCWHRFAGQSTQKEYVIYNATDCSKYTPHYQTGKKKLVCVESHIMMADAYLKPLEDLSKWLLEEELITETVVCGSAQNDRVSYRLNNCQFLTYKGMVSREEIPGIFQNSINLVITVQGACSNAVIESLACGTPVIGFDTGSLKELVPNSAGIIVPYGSNPWKLDIPDTKTLAVAARTVLANWDEYSIGARKVAEERFNTDKMVEAYISVILEALQYKNPTS